MRIVLALAVMALLAAPAFAGGNNGSKLDNQIDKLERKIDRVVVTPSDNRREQLDQLESRLAYKLFQRNNQQDK
jgi:hypothetical protein